MVREREKKETLFIGKKRSVQIKRVSDIEYIYHFKVNPYNKNTKLYKSEKNYLQKQSKRNKHTVKDLKN